MNTNLPTSDQCEEIFHATLRAGDPKGVESALTLLAVQDPHRAQELLDLTRAALAVAREDPSTQGCLRCGRSGGELSENGCPSCGPDAVINPLTGLKEER